MPPRGGWSFTVQGKYGLQRYNDSSIEVAPLESGSIESANHPLRPCPLASPCNHYLPDCEWADWEVEAECSKQCGGGYTTLTRRVISGHNCDNREDTERTDWYIS